MTVKKTPGDKYDNQDEVEFDSEKEIFRGKQNGFRRNSPQVNSTPVIICKECDFSLKDKRSLDEHMKRHMEFQMKCRKCGEPFKTDNDLQNHITNHHRVAAQLNCMSCDFQTNQKDILKSHNNFKHTEAKNREAVDCDKCPMQFMTLWSLRNHNRDVHGPQEECYFFQQGRCKFNQSCWKLHRPSQNNEPFKCFSCKENFKTTNELMRHRKREHIELCKPCSPREGNCRFESNPDRCWFLHKDFQEGGEKEAPPLVIQSSQSNQLNESRGPN